MSDLPLLEPGVMDVITQHVNAARARRVGGILVGKRRNSSVTVQAAVPAPHVDEHDGEIVFLPDVWERAYDIMLERYPGSRIVGWYHSHPGAGPAFSDYDRRLHSVLFSEAPSVALVVDPVSKQAGWYGWVLGRIDPVGLSEEPTIAEERPPGNRAVLAAAVALGVAAAGAVGYWVGHERAPSRASPATIELRTRLGVEQDRARQLGQQLAEAKSELNRVAAREAARRAELEALSRRLRAAEKAGGPRALVLRYRVQPEDTLWSLAERFYGNGWSWRRLFGANAARLRTPNVLLPGQTIMVPLP